MLLLVDNSNAALRARWEESTKQMYCAWAETKFPGQGIAATTIVPAISAGGPL